MNHVHIFHDEVLTYILLLLAVSYGDIATIFLINIYIHTHIHRENKGLNIFNSAYVLADPKTATDVVTKTNNEKRDYMICITITTLTLPNTSDRTSKEFWA